MFTLTMLRYDRNPKPRNIFEMECDFIAYDFQDACSAKGIGNAQRIVAAHAIIRIACEQLFFTFAPTTRIHPPTCFNRAASRFAEKLNNGLAES